jgi:hypothetical protein
LRLLALGLVCGHGIRFFVFRHIALLTVRGQLHDRSPATGNDIQQSCRKTNTLFYVLQREALDTIADLFADRIPCKQIIRFYPKVTPNV